MKFQVFKSLPGSSPFRKTNEMGLLKSITKKSILFNSICAQIQVVVEHKDITNGLFCLQIKLKDICYARFTVFTKV